MQIQGEGHNDVTVAIGKTQLALRLLKKQLKQTARAKKILYDTGIPDDMEFCINFRFAAKNRLAGELLKNYICRETDYNVEIVPEGWLKRYWSVEGSTKPIRISKEIIDTWVSQMVLIGLEHECKFDGWWLWQDNRHGEHRPPRLIASNPSLIRRLGPGLTAGKHIILSAYGDHPESSF
jgi:hypothetical protein